MFKSIIDDIKLNFSLGNMVTKLIIVNIGIFVITALLFAFSKLYPFDTFILEYMALSGEPSYFLTRPWTFISHLFIHGGLFHLLWNMVGLNLFGRITGDLLGDRRILPLYIFGGLIAGITYIVSYHTILHLSSSFAMGASGSIMAIAMTAGLIAPDYIVRLLLIGDVKIKYIVAAFIFLDIIGTQTNDNTGGHFAHLGGALAGLIFIFMYRKGFDVLLPFEKLFNLFDPGARPVRNAPRTRLKVEHRAENRSIKRMQPGSDKNQLLTFQEKLDSILDKIKDQGYEKLTTEEKEFLRDASNKE
ncbi:MAG: rhomboid family intramembrane serine protease [Saprospiraceae bacterium]|nr:rhomboid family intramembrane serine protease [Saprospiraceae bacterium]